MDPLPGTPVLQPKEELIETQFDNRLLYKRLVIDLRQDLVLCMRVIAFWTWLEEVGFENIVPLLIRVNDNTLSLIFHEAVRCLKYIDAPTPPVLTPLYLYEVHLTNFMEGKEIQFSFLYQNRDNALGRINKTVNEVFLRAFDDIIQKSKNIIKAPSSTRQDISAPKESSSNRRV
ncbi:uncharacterized protein LOC113316579 [Papaver somniferum]|uniref:uncharacterized protein LOC113316579 n=1 Tax=Papaver somniferum TaxID=3469 RepID=UPI000E7005A4|nr:uncharacterized protein LOC113316579 [Papaver somniferum]